MLKKQNGSAATGFMVGLLVGLIIAVVIAFFVAKVPVNVFSSSPSTGAALEGDAAAAAGAIPADPNAVLYNPQPLAFPEQGLGNSQTTVSTVATQGAGAALDPNAALAPATPTAEPGATQPYAAQQGTPAETGKAIDKTAEKAAQEAKKAAAAKAKAQKESAATSSVAPAQTPAPTPAKADPLADIISAKSQNDAATKSAANSGSTGAASTAFDYYVQAGAYRNKQDAEQVRAKLQSLGISAKLSERVQGDGTVYRVRSGPFAQRSSADGARDKVASSGMDAVIVSVPR